MAQHISSIVNDSEKPYTPKALRELYKQIKADGVPEELIFNVPDTPLDGHIIKFTVGNAEEFGIEESDDPKQIELALLKAVAILNDGQCEILNQREGDYRFIVKDESIEDFELVVTEEAVKLAYTKQ